MDFGRHRLSARWNLRARPATSADDAFECWHYPHDLRHMGEIELARGFQGLSGMTAWSQVSDQVKRLGSHQIDTPGRACTLG